MSPLSGEKWELLKLLLKKRAGNRPQQIPRLGTPGPHPASFAQERLWFLDQLVPGGSSYNIFAAVRLTGPLDADALARSLTEIVRRHEALRTTVVAVDGRPMQVIAAPGAVPLPCLTLDHLPVAEREGEARRLAESEARRPFDLAADLLLRASLLRLGATEHVVLLTMHHIGSDGWSLGVFIREMAALYRAFTVGEPSPLAEPPIQYADFARWQRAWLDGGVLEAQLAYWRGQLSGAPPVLALPTDHPRPPVQSHRGARAPFEVAKPLVDGLQALCKREGVTPFMALLAAFDVLLARHSGQRDLTVGSPIANRHHIGTEGLIGFFVNTLVLRADLSGDPTFRELVARVREVTLAAYAHQDVPFERLVEDLRPERSLGHQPLFQVMFVLQNAPIQPLELGPLRIDFLPVAAETTKFDLLLSLSELDGRLVGYLEYATDLFAATTIARMAEQLGRLIAGAVADPDRRISALPLLSDDQRREVLTRWNQPSDAPPPSRPVHRLVEAQAALTPEAIAVTFADGASPTSLTYRELERRANQLAHHLVRIGVGPDVPVGISVERSLEMVVGVLGILKAGGAYVPLDPAYPKDRLAFMIDDVRAGVIVTQRRLVDGLPPHRARLVCLDEPEAFAEASDPPPVAALDVEHLAYVIYTSGSTGRPKGIALPHRALTNLIEWHLCGLLCGARTLQFASLNFDASFHEMFAALASGGTVLVIPESLRQDVSALGRYLSEAAVEKIILPVVVLQQIAEELADSDGALAALREVTTTGEQLQITRPIVRLFQRLSQVSFHNHYGPSETHVVTALTLTDPPERWPMHPSIGRAIRATQVYVLDENLEPAPLGVVGELYLGGVMLARGYHGRPELTAERFIPDRFAARPGSRLYRTGDLARLRSDGQIEFLGRRDHQVKIRGFRVELGEVEAVLGQHPSVREVIVVARDDPGGKRLVGYVVPEGAPAPTVSELRRFLSQKLPEHMVPSAFVMLAALPLTANGKIDRRALPAPSGGRPALERAYVAPRTPVEALLATVWARTLQVEQVGVNDNFFDLGGHSMVAVQLIASVKQATQVDVALRTLFESPSVAEMAVAIEGARGAAVAVPSAGFEVTAPIPRRRDRATFPTSFNQESVWRVQAANPRSRFYHIAGAVVLEGALDVDALSRALSEIVRRHEVLRARFATENDQLIQRIAPPAPIVLPVIDTGGVSDGEREAEAATWAQAEALRPFDLAAEPPIRVALVRLAAERHALVLVAHHIAFDGYSSSVFFGELKALYGAYSRGEPSDLPELAIQYADFAAWQRALATTPAGEAECAWWKARLAGTTPLRLPTRAGVSIAALESSSAAAVAWEVGPELFASLGRLQRNQGVTLLMTMLTGFVITLHLVSGQEDVAVGNGYAYRDRGGAAALIGFVVNPLVVRVAVTDALSLREVLLRVRDAVLDARTHFDSHVRRFGAAMEWYRINFNFLPPAPVPSLPGLRVAKILPLSHDETLFDLALFMQAREGGVGAQVLYRDAMFERATVLGILDLYRAVLEAMGGEGDPTVGDCRR